MKRIAIIVSKSLSAGMVANVAAILAGQLGSSATDFFGDKPVDDRNDRKHAVVNQNVAVLKANGAEQLVNSYDAASANPKLHCILFTGRGQATSNDVDAYLATLANANTAGLCPVGLLVAGPDADVRAATKKFSVYS